MTSSLPVNGFVNSTNPQTVHGETVLSGTPSSEKGKEWQMELLMEKLRAKASSYKTLVETAKNVRMTMLDKRFGIDSIEKSQLQKSLDALQHSIKVTTLQSMIERLESLSRQLGLKFMMTGSTTGTTTDLFISSDMFYLEVLLESSGAVKDVKIHHEGKTEQQSCEELVACLSRGDFVDFTMQLEGLASIYQLNADKKVKCKAFSALQSLENDLGVLAQLQTFIKEPFNLVHKSPVGILERRKGGHAMKLTYFVSPYDLIDKENKSCETLSIETVISKKVGHSVTVCMEGSTAHKLPISSIISVTRGPTGKSTPSYAPLTSANSSMLPACFVLKLAKKMPMCLELIRRIQKVTELECTDVSATAPLLSMIVQHASEKQLDCQNNKGLSVSLPDQQHCYFMTENQIMKGVLVGSIPFTHPAHVPQILVYLRQQALFNTLIASCVRPMARHNFDLSTTIFEVSALSWQCISVSLEHPFEETLATAELDLSDISAVKCKLYGTSVSNNEQISEIAGKVLQRCLSIPLTMRTLIKAWEGRTFTLNPTNANSNGSNYNNNMNQSNGQPPQHNGTNGPEFGDGEIKIKQEPGINGSGRQQQNNNQQQQQSFLDAGAENSIGFPALSGSTDTSLVQTDAVNKKARKRKVSEMSSWKSPKVKDIEPGEIVLESSSSDSTPLGTPKEEPRTPTPTSIDLSNVDTLEVISTDKSSDYDLDSADTDVVQIEPPLEKKAKKEKPSTASVLEDTKALVSPSVSITPITNQSSSYNTMLSNMGLERRPGIEIIPIASLAQTQLPSSITITAITNPNKMSTAEDKNKVRKSSKINKNVDEKSKFEKKRKRKRDSSPTMGPPAPLKQQDPLSKPVSVSIKPAGESPPTSRPTSPAMRKFSPSPTHGIVLLGKSSPTPGLRQSPVGAGKPSPKHSPVYSSPKHMSPMPGSSPKHGTSSPKHSNSGSSGKPSLSTLKSASTSPKGDTPKTKTPPSMSPSSSPSVTVSALSTLSSSTNVNKEKEGKRMVFGGSSPGHQSPKSKSAPIKTKVSDVESQANRSDSATPPDPNKSVTTQAQARNRKGSLSAVIDKLKNAQHCSDDAIIPSSGSTAQTTNVPGKSGDAKNPTEYMVKPSSDGMKLTINKTRTKDLKNSTGGSKMSNVGISSSSASGALISSSGNGSPKTYTGLKPGVVAGPASKKSQAQNTPKVRSASPLTPSSSKSNTSSVQKLGIKSSSSSNLLSSSSSSNLANKSSLSKSFSSLTSKQGLMSATDLARAREKARLKSGDKFGSKESDSEKAFKLLAAHASSMSNSGLQNLPGLPAQLVVEGLIKQLDTNFQIPKLSARTNAAENEKRSVDKVDSGSNKPTASAKIEDHTNTDADLPTNLSMQPDDQSKAEVSAARQFCSSTETEVKESSQGNDGGNGESLNLTSKQVEKDQSFHRVSHSDKKMTEHNVTTAGGSIDLTTTSTSSQEAAEMLLDFSAPKDTSVKAAITYAPSSSPMRKNTTPPPPPPPPPPLPPPLPPPSNAVSPVGFPQSPSVSLHIVKSPAPSPRVIPLSPHSASPCITDDELMDEALVGS